MRKSLLRLASVRLATTLIVLASLTIFAVWLILSQKPTNTHQSSKTIEIPPNETVSEADENFAPEDLTAPNTDGNLKELPHAASTPRSDGSPQDSGVAHPGPEENDPSASTGSGNQAPNEVVIPAKTEGMPSVADQKKQLKKLLVQAKNLEVKGKAKDALLAVSQAYSIALAIKDEPSNEGLLESAQATLERLELKVEEKAGGRHQAIDPDRVLIEN